MKLLRTKSLTTYDIWLLAQCAAVSTKRSEISVPPQNHSIPESFPPIRWVRPSAAMCGNSPTLVFHPPTRYSVNRKALAPPPPKITTTKHKVLNILKARIFGTLLEKLHSYYRAAQLNSVQTQPTSFTCALGMIHELAFD